MAGITLEHAEAQLALWLAASEAVASGQEYEIDTGNGRRRLRRTDAKTIMEMIASWDGWVKKLTPSGRRPVKYIVPDMG